MAVKNISFDEGYKSFTLNGDKDRVIRFNPSDSNIVKRAQEAGRKIAQSVSALEEIPLKADGTPEKETEAVIRIMDEFEAILREQLNHIFNSDVYDIVFNGQSPLSIVGKEKKYLFEAFLDSVIPIMAGEIEEDKAATQKRIAKYTKGY